MEMINDNVCQWFDPPDGHARGSRELLFIRELRICFVRLSRHGKRKRRLSRRFTAKKYANSVLGPCFPLPLLTTSNRFDG